MTTPVDIAGFRVHDTPQVRDDARRWLVSRIKEAGCVQRRPVTLSSGRQSDYYVNLRLLTLGPYLGVVARAILNYIPDTGEPITCVAGVLSAAAPLVAGCVALAGIPLRGLLIRREAKRYGTRDLIEGPIGHRDTAFLLDDVATSGDSLEHGIRCLVDAGIRVAGALVLLDRTGEAGPRLAQFDVPFTAILTPQDLGIEDTAPRKINDNALPKPPRVRREAYTIYVGEGCIDIDDLPADREALVGLLRSLDPPLSDGELGMLWYGCGPLPFAIREAISAAIDEARTEGKKVRHDEERRRQIVASQRQDLDRGARA